MVDSRPVISAKSKRSNGFLRCSQACTLPQVLRQIHTTVAVGHAALVQVACATIGAACAAWSFLWMTPSSFEQKEFTPVVLKRQAPRRPCNPSTGGRR